jgi:hypothetical protein
MLRKASFFLLATCLLSGGLAADAFAAGPDADEPGPIVLADTSQILGHWQRGEGEAIIEITERNGVFSGVVVWSERRPETVGIEVFRQLRFSTEDGEWHGRAYSIKRKREVPIDIGVPKPDELELTAHILFFEKDVDFKRVPTAVVAKHGVKTGL